MIRIVLIDDHAVVRTGYRRLLSAEADFEVVGEAASADEANALVQRSQPDVALVDLNLKGSSGLEAIRGMLARKPGLRVLVLSMYDSAGHVRQALKSGAHGYLTKFSEPDDVIDAIDWAIDNQKAFNIRVINLSLGAPVVPRGAGSGLSGGANAVDGSIVLSLEQGCTGATGIMSGRGRTGCVSRRRNQS